MNPIVLQVFVPPVMAYVILCLLPKGRLAMIGSLAVLFLGIALCLSAPVFSTTDLPELLPEAQGKKEFSIKILQATGFLLIASAALAGLAQFFRWKMQADLAGRAYPLLACGLPLTGLVAILLIGI